MLAAVTDPKELAPGTRALRTPEGWCASHPIPLAQLNAARPEVADPGFLDLVSREHAGVWSRVSVTRALDGLGPLLEARGYHPRDPVELWSLDLRGRPAPEARAEVRLARTAGEVRGWCAAALRLRGLPEALDPGLPWGLLVGSAHHLVLEEREGEVRGVGALQVIGGHGIGLLWGAVTAPRWRRQGVHRALLEARLVLARRAGLELVLALGAPSGGGPALARAGFAPSDQWVHTWDRPPRPPERSGQGGLGQQG